LKSELFETNSSNHVTALEINDSQAKAAAAAAVVASSSQGN
jgi:hypothetical protein